MQIDLFGFMQIIRYESPLLGKIYRYYPESLRIS